MSTNSPAFARRAFTQLTARGFDFLEAPVSLERRSAQLGTLTIMAAARRRRSSVTGACSRPWPQIYFLEAAGSAQLAKLVSNFFRPIVAIGSVAEALVLGTKGGVRPTVMYDILENSIADSRVLRNIGPRILAGDFSPIARARPAFKTSISPSSAVASTACRCR